jgi:hypothetical protein
VLVVEDEALLALDLEVRSGGTAGRCSGLGDGGAGAATAGRCRPGVAEVALLDANLRGEPPRR